MLILSSLCHVENLQCNYNDATYEEYLRNLCKKGPYIVIGNGISKTYTWYMNERMITFMAITIKDSLNFSKC